MEKKVSLKKFKKESDWEFKVMQIRRVARVTAGGKRFKVRAVVIGGNKKGIVGVGIEKGMDIAQAVEKAERSAQKNAIQVPIVGPGTIPYEVGGKVGAGEVLLKPAKEGKGLIAGGPVRTLLSLAGYSNVTAKIIGVTKNPLINTLAAMEALKNLSKSYQNKVNIRENLLKLTKKDDTSAPNPVSVET
jgi:small subunit ribosomal protein S5